VDRRTVAFPDDKSVFKVYYVSIVGRDDPSAYEWDHCGITPADFASALTARAVEGIGFVTAFPHITKIFRFAPSAETIMHVTAFRTRDWGVIPLDREDGYVEYACLAEALVAADEYAFWADAEDVDAYLGQWSACQGGAVRKSDKLMQYWA
jgi:hypothetical protein